MYLYFIRQVQPRGNCPIKIGVSDNPDFRLKKLQCGNPDKLELITKIELRDREDAFKMERTIHWLLEKKHKRLMGEWFVIYGGIKEVLEQAYKLCRVEPVSGN